MRAQRKFGGPATNVLLEDLNELARLRAEGMLSEAEFERRRSDLISEAIVSPGENPGP
jgi:Short C-terminal domain